MPKLFDPDKEHDKKIAAWRRSPKGKEIVRLREEKLKKDEAAYKNPEKSPYKDMLWSRKHGRWVWPDKRSADQKRRDNLTARNLERARRIWKPIEERIPKSWGPHVSCGLGWKDLIFGLARDIDRVWEGFMGWKGRDCWILYQAKEKFGGLRFYVGRKFRLLKKDSARIRDEYAWRSRLMHLLIKAAEHGSSYICQICAREGAQSRSVDGWIAVECYDHYRERLQKRFEERRRHDKKLKIEDLMDEEELEKIKRAKKRKKA